MPSMAAAPAPATRPAPKRIGHGGAGALVRANTLASFDAAARLGVDMIEFDVRLHEGRLLLAHTKLHARLLPCPTLDAALAHLSGPAFARIGVNVDLKQLGAEAPTVRALQRAGFADRALLSSQCPAIVDRVRRLDRGIRTGISVGGRVSRAVQRWGAWRSAVLADLERGRYDALMLHHPLVDERLVAETHERGSELHAWTVDDPASIGALVRLGVDGVCSNDPRLFGAMA
jgi:glycerophosphoryl diester phosphodiesterase